MANKPHPDKRAVTYRLHRDLIERVKEAAEQQDVTVTSFVTRALETELDGGAVSFRVHRWWSQLAEGDRQIVRSGIDRNVPLPKFLSDELVRAGIMPGASAHFVGSDSAEGLPAGPAVRQYLHEFAAD